MSTDNAARFYWGKLERATAIFEKGNNEEAKDICCQLINEFRCPRFCQVDARKLLSRCYHDNYWFAKSSLDRALEICVSCESYDGATKLDLQALADLMESVEAMLRDRLRVYCEYWAAKGRKPPSEDEWQEITEAEAEAQDTTDGCYEVVKDEKGNPLSGPVKAWPFKGPGKHFPTVPVHRLTRSIPGSHQSSTIRYRVTKRLSAHVRYDAGSSRVLVDYMLVLSYTSNG
jgi:hypothetical protein